jgi:hypothetical protein
MYIGAPAGPLSSPRMQTYVHAMWLVCANMVLWATTLLLNFLTWRRRRLEMKRAQGLA